MRWQNDAQGGELLCNRDTLVGALLNLVENALQACSGACRLKIHLYRRDATLHLCISDNGRGIEAGILGRLGEPFFTTRTMEPASGLRSRRLSPVPIKASCACFPGQVAALASSLRCR